MGIERSCTLVIELKQVPVALCDDPALRSQYDTEFCRSLGEDMKSNGQQVPVIGYKLSGRFPLVDGGCRLEGARLVGIPELLALDMGKEPTRLELLLAQASIDVHRQNLPPIDRARLWDSIIDARKCTARELAVQLHVSDSLVGRYLPLLTLAPELQEEVNNGTLEMSKGSLIARETNNPDRQRELAALAASMSRESLAAVLRKKRNGNGSEQPASETVRTSRVKCELGGNLSIVVAGNDLGLDEVIEALGTVRRAAIKARHENWDVKSWSAVMRDRAKKGS
jgi:ParB family chromosome partitioning protein